MRLFYQSLLVFIFRPASAVEVNRLSGIASDRPTASEVRRLRFCALPPQPSFLVDPVRITRFCFPMSFALFSSPPDRSTVPHHRRRRARRQRIVFSWPGVKPAAPTPTAAPPTPSIAGGGSYTYRRNRCLPPTAAVLPAVSFKSLFLHFFLF